MGDQLAVSVEVAGVEQAPLLTNLLELYCHDLSPFFDLKVGPDGRFGYSRLPLYWSQPEKRRAFLIRHDADLAGFILMRMESPLAEIPADFDVTEFFVLRRHRRSGVGRGAAFQLWDRYPGSWMVRVAESHKAARSFWETIIEAYTSDTFTQSRHSVDGRDRRVFVFSSLQADP